MSEIESLRADLAAARAALQPLADLPSSDGPPIIAGDNVKQSFYVRTGDVRNAREVLSRLGTGEALAAVREAQRFLDSIEGIYGSTAGVKDCLTRLRAVFGEVNR